MHPRQSFDGGGVLRHRQKKVLFFLSVILPTKTISTYYTFHHLARWHPLEYLSPCILVLHLFVLWPAGCSTLLPPLRLLCPLCIFVFTRQEMIAAPSQDPGAEDRGTETRTLARFANVFPQVLVMDPTAVSLCSVCQLLRDCSCWGLYISTRPC